MGEFRLSARKACRVGRSGSRRSAAIPVEVTSFVGRRQEVGQAKRLLSASRVLTLTGATGVGKTRLALRTADELSRAFPDGVWLIQFAPLQDETLVPRAIADVLGIRDETNRDSLAVLVAYLRDRRLLLVLDNCEHLLDACARVVDAVLRAGAGVRVLATSQHRLGVAGEQGLDVAPVPVPDPGELTGVIDASVFPAIELFADRATAVDPRFRITAHNQRAVATVCRQLDGVPLAIELAAALTRTLAVEQLVERLDDRFRLLTRGSRTAMPRHQTLRAAVDWSYELCTAREQLVWALLSVFAGTCDLAGAEAVCAEESIASAEVLDAISGLVDKSVLVSERDGATVRYRLLSSLQEYGLDKLTRLGKASTARRSHRDYYLHLVEDYEKQWFGPRQAEILNHLRAQHDNLRAAFHFCLTTPGEAQKGLHLAGSLWFYWNCRGASGEGRQWMRDLALRESAKQLGVREKAYWAVGLTTAINNRTATTLLAGNPSPAPAPEQADPPLPPLTETISVSGDLITLVVLSRIELASTLVLGAQPEPAVSLCLEALAVCRQHGEQWSQSHVLRTLATALWAMGEYDRATALARECLRLDHAVLGPQGLGRTLDVLAATAASQGDAVRAAVLLGTSETIWPTSSRGPAEQYRHAGRVRVSEQQARQALGERGFTEAFRRGSALTLEQAVAYALQNRSELPTRGQAPAPKTGMSSGLTEREMQVAELVAQGLSNREIAVALVISQRTAESHVEHILAKLGFTSRTQVAAWFTNRP